MHKLIRNSIEKSQNIPAPWSVLIIQSSNSDNDYKYILSHLHSEWQNGTHGVHYHTESYIMNMLFCLCASAARPITIDYIMAETTAHHQQCICVCVLAAGTFNNIHSVDLMMPHANEYELKRVHLIYANLLNVPNHLSIHRTINNLISPSLYLAGLLLVRLYVTLCMLCNGLAAVVHFNRIRRATHRHTHTRTRISSLSSSSSRNLMLIREFC